MTDRPLPAAAGEPLDPAFDYVGGSLPAIDIADAVQGADGQGEVTPVDDGSSTDAGYEPPAPPDAAPRSDEPASFAGQMAEVAAPRANDAMRVLSRMQIDLDLVTEGKRAATYGEVDTAFDDAVKALGIRLPSAKAADEGGIKAAGVISAPMAGGNVPGEPFEQDAMEDEQQGPGITPSPPIVTPPASASSAPAGPAPAPAPATKGDGSAQSAASPASQAGNAKGSGAPSTALTGAAANLWQSGKTVFSPAGLPVSVTGLNLTEGDYLDSIKKGLWSRIEGDDNNTIGFKDDKAVSAASAAVQKQMPVSAVDVSSPVDLRRFIKDIAKATATAALHGRGKNDDFERFFTVGRNSANQLVITSIHVVGRQGAHVMTMIPPGSIVIAHYHGSGLVQPPNSGDNSAVRLGNISSFVIGNGGDTVWEIGRDKGREVFREIRRGGVPGRWQRYRP